MAHFLLSHHCRNDETLDDPCGFHESCVVPWRVRGNSS